SFTRVDMVTWNTLFWIIMLFTSVNAIAKSFLQESIGTQLYYYTIADPRAIILSKMAYNLILMLVLSMLALLFFTLLMGNPLVNFWIFFLSILLGSVGFSLAFTLISAIASKAGSNSSLMAILSFPVIIPLLIVLIRLSKNAFIAEPSGIGRDVSVLLSIDVIIVTTGFILFPYLWKD
ncbi:MAG: heme exporter protein CcmB, partial [Bacteroidetes bacterium]|nr:heme exporter protein CcmB [Bacteroidota bacterium]